jgi:hypothetical protein
VFNAQPHELHSLPIEGMMYRWSCDLAGPLPITTAKNQYAFIAIEHFTKVIVIEALPAKEAQNTSRAFLAHVLGKFGACAEVVTDQGKEWLGEFHQLLELNRIDHRTTSPYHPQANGLTERAVQTVKRALSKFCAQAQDATVWDLHMHYVVLGYNCSPQASTRCSPYQLLYGVPPTLPPAIKERMQEPLPLGAVGAPLGPQTQDEAAEYLLDRADLLHQDMAMAGHNQKIAQHRDQLRYAQKRSGMWAPGENRIAPGDFVYLKRPNRVSKLQPLASEGVFRVHTVKDSGTVIIQGHCGRFMPVHISNVAPCHLSTINPAINPALALVEDDHACDICGSPHREESMLLCDACNRGYHLDCLTPPLTKPPSSSIWICPHCEQLGVTIADVKQLNTHTQHGSKPVLIFKNKAQRLRDAQARELVGRLVKWEPKGHTWGSGPFIGQLEYVFDNGRRARPLVGIFPQGRGPAWDLATATKLLLPEHAAEGALVALLSAEQPVEQPVSILLSWSPIQPQLSGYARRMEQLSQQYAASPLDISSRLKPEHVKALQQALGARAFQRGLDGWWLGAGTGGEHPLGGLAHTFRTNALAPGADFALQPLSIHTHARIKQQYNADLYVCIVPPAALDAYLPLAHAFTTSLVCALVPVTYTTRTHRGRADWLHSVERDFWVSTIPIQGDLHHVWLLLGKTAHPTLHHRY